MSAKARNEKTFFDTIELFITSSHIKIKSLKLGSIDTRASTPTRNHLATSFPGVLP